MLQYGHHKLKKSVMPDFCGRTVVKRFCCILGFSPYGMGESYVIKKENLKSSVCCILHGVHASYFYESGNKGESGIEYRVRGFKRAFKDVEDRR